MIYPNYKNITKLAIPVMAGTLIHYLFTFADKFFISKLGIEQAAGHSIISTILWVLFTFTTLVSGGTLAMVSRKKGENNNSEFKSTIQQSLLLATVTGTIIITIGYYTGDLMFKFFNVEKSVEIYGKEYYHAFLPGYLFLYISVTMSVIFQASGDTKTPMFIFSLLSILNILLDPIFIYGISFIPAMGIKGGAYATVLSEFLALLYMSFLFKRKFKINLFSKPDITMMKRILKIGFWSGLSGFSRPVSGLVLHKVIAFYKTEAIVSFGFAIQWLTLAFVFFEGIRVAVSTLVGQYLGAKKFDYLKILTRKALLLGFFIISVIIIFTFIYSEEAIEVFSKDKKVVELGSSYLRIVMTSLLFNVPLTVYSAIFNGAGDTKPPMIASFIANWPVKIFMIYLTTYILKLSITYIWYAVALSVIIEATIIYLWYLKGNWINKKI